MVVLTWCIGFYERCNVHLYILETTEIVFIVGAVLAWSYSFRVLMKASNISRLLLANGISVGYLGEFVGRFSKKGSSWSWIVYRLWPWFALCGRMIALMLESLEIS